MATFDFDEDISADLGSLASKNDFGSREKDFDELSVVSSKSGVSMKSAVSSYAGSDLSPMESVEKKKKLLFQIKRLEKRGFTISRNYDMDSSISEMKAEIDSVKREANLDSGTKMAKTWLTTICSTLEMANQKFDPFDLVLDGWSEEVHNSVESGDYDDVMEELYDKYYDKIQMPPEIRLLMMVGGSAVNFHITNTMMKATLPGAEEMLKKNPKMQQEIMNVIKRNEPQYHSSVQTIAQGGIPQQYQQRPPMQPKHDLKPPSFDVDDIMNEIENDVMDTSIGVKKDKKGLNVLEL